MVLLTGNHFWSSVARASTGSLESLTWSVCIRKSEIDNLDIIIVIHQKIFRLQVSVADAQLVHILNTRNDLVQELGSLLLPYPLVINNVLEEFPTSCILHD